MTFPYTGVNPNAEDVAGSIDAQISRLVFELQSFRTAAASGGISSLLIRSIYISLTSIRLFVETKKSVNGLGPAFTRRFPDRAAFNPATEWATSKAAIDTLVNWFKTNVPKDGAGRPTFEQYRTGTDELEAYSLTPSTTLRNQLLAQIDGVLATFG